MISRSSSAILSLTSLLVGVFLGMMSGRGGPIVSAQVAGTTRSSGSLGADPIPGSSRGQASGPQDARQSREDQLYATLAKQYEQFQQVNRTFELVAKAVSPTVVHIVAQKVSRHESANRARQFEETGSGVIVRSDRSAGLFVLTNHHVVDGSEPARIQIRLHDGRTVAPEKVLSDVEADIAVLKLEQSDLPASRMGNSDDVAVGTWVLALGSPFGLMQSVSQGIIAARGRHMEELQEIYNQDFFQTDAAINPGNSGGPLVNMKGEVIGINNSIASEGGGNEGVGFSIPINLARWIMNELVARGRVSRGALGVDLHPTYRQKDAVALGLDRPRGAWVEVVHPLTPAASGGLHDGDVILRFGGVEIGDLNHLINMVSMAPIGEAADLSVWRDRHEIRLKVTIGERERPITQPAPRNEGPVDAPGFIRRPDRPATPTTFAMGLELKTLSAKLLHDLSLPDSLKGAIVVTVDPESVLAEFCRPNDVVSTIGGRAIATAEQAVRLLNGRTEAGPLIVEVDRPGQNGEVQRLAIQIP
jgi:serine protease Do